jgi:2'-5' RNA ligase
MTPVTIAADINKRVVGYVVNTTLSAKGQRAVSRIQKRLTAQFPDTFCAAPPESLHITLLDLLTPVVAYAEDTDVLFEKLQDSYLLALMAALEAQHTIRISFDTIELFPSALIVKGSDDGSFQRIREAFTAQATLLPGTKRPPAIVHSTIGKFTKAIPIGDVTESLTNERLSFDEIVQDFCLVRETKVFMLEYQVLQQLKLGS